MANGADGSITIDTRIDNTGFQRGTQQMQNAATGLTNTVNRMGQSMANSVQSVIPALQNLTQSTQQSGAEIAQNLGASGFSRALADIQKQAGALSSQFSRLSDSETLGVKTDAQMARFSLNVDKARDSLITLTQSLTNFANQPINTAEYERLQSEFERLDAKLASLYQKQNMMQQLGVDPQSMQYQRLSLELENVGKEYDTVREKMQAMREAGTAAQLGGNTEQYQALAEQINGLAEQLQHYQEVAASFPMNGGAQGGAPLSGLEQNFVQSLNEQMGLASDASNDAAASLAAVDAELQQKPQDASAAAGGFSMLGEGIRGAGEMVQGLLTHLGNLGRAAVNAASTVARLTFRGLARGAAIAGQGIKKLDGILSGFRKQSGKSVLTSNGLVKALTNVKRMLLTRIKRTFISALFNSLKSGMQAFAQYSSAFNEAMSSMKNSMTGLSGNLAVFAGGLVNAIAPAISTIIDWISQAITYINALFALLSGKSTYSVAKKGTDSYAESLKGAGGAAKELKEQVYGFDELNKEQDNSGGGGGGGDSGSVEFEEKSLSDLPASISGLFDQIKEAIIGEQWEQVGSLVAGGMNNIVTYVNGWITGTFRPAATQWADNIARIMNGIVGGLDWNALGSVFGNGLNTITATLHSFFIRFDFKALGAGFAKGVNGIFTSIEWDNLGVLIGEGLNSISKLLDGFYSTINWDALGLNFSKGVNSMFLTVNWLGLGSSIAKKFNGIITTLRSAITNVDWDNMADSIAAGINAFLDGVNWAGLITTAWLGIKNLTTTIAKAVSKINFSGWAKSIGTGFNSLFAETDWNQLGTDLAASFNSVISGFETLVTGIDWATMAKSIGNGANSLLSKVNWSSLVFSVFYGVASIGTSLISAIATIDFSKIGAELAAGLNKVFGKDENGESLIDWDELGHNFGKIIVGLIEGVVTFIKEVNWAQIGEALETCVYGLFEELGEAIAGWFNLPTPDELTEELLERFGITSEPKFTYDNRYAGTAFGDLFRYMGSDANNAAAEMFKQIDQLIADGSLGMEARVAQAVYLMQMGYGDAVQAVSPALSETASLLMTALDPTQNPNLTITDVIIAYQNAGFNMTGALAQAILDGQISVETAAAGLIYGLDAELMATMTEDDIRAAIAENYRSIGQEAGAALGESAVSSADAGVNAGIDALENRSDDLADSLDIQDQQATLEADNKGTAQSGMEAVGEGVAEGLPDATTAAEDAVEAVTNPFEGLPAETEAQALLMMQAIQAAIVSGEPQATSAIAVAAQAVVDRAAQLLSNGEGQKIGKAFMQGISTGIASTKSALTQFAASVVQAARTAMTDFVGTSGSAFAVIGEQICYGIVAGLRGKSSVVTYAARSVAQAAYNAAADELGIQSPSKAFAEIGEYMMEGMEIGLKDGQSDVTRTVANIAENLLDGFSETPSLDVDAQSMVNGLDNVADRLAQVAATFAAIAAAISSMGGLDVPAVASGSFTPYKARVDDSDDLRGSFGALTDDLKRYQTDMGEDMSDIRSLIRELLETLKRKNMSVDGRSLERSLSGLNRDRIQSYGGA